MGRATITVGTLLAGILAAGNLGLAQTPVEPGFSQTTFVGGLSGITDLEWATDGSNILFVTEKAGRIRVISGGTLQSSNVASLSVDNAGERGLIGLAVDPQFSSNGYIYVFATMPGGTEQRIVRYTVSGSPGNYTASGTRLDLVSNIPCAGANHDGGALVFGADGYLYFGVGNLGNGSGVFNNGTGRDGNADEYDTLASKISRVHKANGNPVAGGPFAGQGSMGDYMYSRGYRNPFGMVVQPGTNALWVLEVGDGMEHIFVATPGSNRGWPQDNNTSTTNGKLIPRFGYQGNSGSWTGGSTGCITRGCFYTGSTYGAQYQGNLFFAEYKKNKVIRCRVNGTNTFTLSDTSSFVDNASNVVDVVMGPDSALYYNSGGTILRLQSTSVPAQAIQVSPGSMTVDEGGAAGTFTVTLTADPGGSGLTVNVNRTSGDSDIIVDPSTATLNFTSSNWSTGLPARVSAQEDGDTVNGSATITFSASGLTSVNRTVTENDNDTLSAAPTVSISDPLNGQVVSGTAAEFYGDATDDVMVTHVEFWVGNTLEYTDVNPGVVGYHFHVGGDHNLWDTTQYPDGQYVLNMIAFDADGQTGSQQILVTIANNTAIFQQDSGTSNIVSMEAENNVQNTAQGGHDWTATTAFPGYSGAQAMQATPADGTNNNAAGYSSISPRLDYLVEFVTTGTHYVWVRGLAPSGAGNDDSVHVGLDGLETPSSDRINNTFGTTWSWSKATMDGPDATINVTTVGVHAINVWMRESGFAIDKVVITSDAGYTPTGAGPAQSAQVGGGGGGGGGGGNGSSGGCGATGVEVLLVLLGAGALRRRRRR